MSAMPAFKRNMDTVIRVVLTSRHSHDKLLRLPPFDEKFDSPGRCEFPDR